MAKLETKLYVNESEVLTPAIWAKQYANGITEAAVYFLRASDKIDWIELHGRIYIVMSEKTRSYKPRRENRTTWKKDKSEQKVKTTKKKKK